MSNDIILWRRREPDTFKWNYVITKNVIEKRMLLDNKNYEVQKVFMFDGLRDMCAFIDDVCLLRHKMVKHMG